jgi:hypothetical protein
MNKNLIWVGNNSLGLGIASASALFTLRMSPWSSGSIDVLLAILIFSVVLAFFQAMTFRADKILFIRWFLSSSIGSSLGLLISAFILFLPFLVASVSLSYPLGSAISFIVFATLVLGLLGLFLSIGQSMSVYSLLGDTSPWFRRNFFAYATGGFFYGSLALSFFYLLPNLDIPFTAFITGLFAGAVIGRITMDRFDEIFISRIASS